MTEPIEIKLFKQWVTEYLHKIDSTQDEKLQEIYRFKLGCVIYDLWVSGITSIELPPYTQGDSENGSRKSVEKQSGL